MRNVMTKPVARQLQQGSAGTLREHLRSLWKGSVSRIAMQVTFSTIASRTTQTWEMHMPQTIERLGEHGIPNVMTSLSFFTAARER